VSARAERLVVPAIPAAIAPATVVVGGLALLLARVAVPVRLLTPAVLASGYATLLLASLTGTAGRATERVAPAAAGAIGALAVVAARLVAGPAVGSSATVAVVLVGSLAAVAEEAFFRRFLYARLEAAGAILAVILSAFLFAAIHVPAYGWGAFPVDLAAGVLFSWQRWVSGSWAAPASTHVLANLLAVIR
jgi:membrane protease YdiL (CAAX protease family)